MTSDQGDAQGQSPNVGGSADLPEPLKGGAATLRVQLQGGSPAADTARAASATTHLGGDAQEFACHVHTYLREYIASSDKKAAFVFAVATTLLIYLYQVRAQVRWLKNPTTWVVGDMFTFLAMFLLFLGAACCAMVVAPRFTRTHRGFVYFGSIAEFESASDYSSSIFSETRIQLTQALLKHNFDLARICRAKFRVLVCGIWFTVVGLGLAILVLILSGK